MTDMLMVEKLEQLLVESLVAYWVAPMADM